MDTINIIAYYFDSVVAYFVYYLTYLYENFREFAWVIKVAAISVTLALTLVLFCLGRLAYLSWNRRRWRKLMERLEKRYGEGITYVLSAEAKPTMSRDEVMDALELSDADREKPGKALLKNDRERLALCRLIYRARISENASLGRRRNLHVLLNIFALQDFLEALVGKGNMRLKAEALNMMRAFKIQVNQWIANSLMNSKRNSVRRLAMYASIMANANTDLDYFGSKFFDENCCIYDEIQLGYILQRRRSIKRKIPNLAHWAYVQKNPETQCVFIRLMRLFNQREYCADLEELFQRDSEKEVIEEISRTWGYLGYTEGEEQLSEVLLTQPDETKVAIMHALARMDTGKSLASLVDGFRHSGNPQVRFEALRCLYNYGEPGRAKFAELEHAATEADKKSLFAFFHNKITLDQLVLSKTDVYTSQYGDNLYSVV